MEYPSERDTRKDMQAVDEIVKIPEIVDRLARHGIDAERFAIIVKQDILVRETFKQLKREDEYRKKHKLY